MIVKVSDKIKIYSIEMRIHLMKLPNIAYVPADKIIA